MIGIIAAVSQNGIIGIENKLPFNYPEDMAHFKQTTLNSTIIMGRNTFESIGKPLSKRKNIVITSKKISIPNIITFDSIEGALQNENNVWFIGGAQIYEEAMAYADTILLTIMPDIIKSINTVKFPLINPTIFELNNINFLKLQTKQHDVDQLSLCTYKRK
jgi:dihydrofolate reductase